MNRSALIISLVALVTGVFAGRLLRSETAQAPAGVNASASAAPVSPAVPRGVDSAIAEESPAIFRVFTALRAADFEQSSGLYQAIELLSPEELEKVRESLTRMPADVARLLRPSLLERWARTHPAEAAMNVREMKDNARFNDKDGIAYAWAQTNPELALAEATRLGSKSGKGAFLRKTAITFLAQRDPSMAMDYVEAIQDSPEKDGLLTTVASELGRRNPEAASAWLASRLPKLKIGAEGSELVNRLLESMTKKDAARAKAEVAKLPELLRRSAAREVGDELVSYNVPTGLEWCAENDVFADPDNERGSSPFETAISRDREAAAAWALKQPGGRTRDYALAQLVPSAKTAEDLLRFFSTMSPEAQAQNISQTVQSYARLGKFEDTSRWVEAIGDESAKESAVATLVYSTAGTKPAEVTGWLEKMPPGNVRSSGAAAIFNSNSPIVSDPKVAEKFLGFITDEGSRQQAATQAYVGLSFQDPAKGAEWLDSLASLSAEQKLAIKQNAPRRQRQLGNFR